MKEKTNFLGSLKRFWKNAINSNKNIKTEKGIDDADTEELTELDIVKEKLFSVLNKHHIHLPYPMTPSPEGYSDAEKYYKDYVEPCFTLFKLDNYYRDQGYTTYFIAFSKETETPYIIGATFSDWHVSYTSYDRKEISYEALNELAGAFGYTKYVNMNADNWKECIE